MIVLLIKACLLTAGILFFIGLFLLLTAGRIQFIIYSILLIGLAMILSLMNPPIEEKLEAPVSVNVEQSIDAHQAVKQAEKDKPKIVLWSILGFVLLSYVLFKVKTYKQAHNVELKSDANSSKIENSIEQKNDDLVKSILKYDTPEDFAERLVQVHELFSENNFQHSRASSFYTIVLPRVSKTLGADLELQEMGLEKTHFSKMYFSLNEWLDEIIEDRIESLESEAEINSRVVTLFTM